MKVRGSIPQICLFPLKESSTKQVTPKTKKRKGVFHSVITVISVIIIIMGINITCGDIVNCSSDDETVIGEENPEQIIYRGDA